LKFNTSNKLSLLVLILSFSQLAHADFVGRLGGQAYYDTETNLTWLINGGAITGTKYDEFGGGLTTWYSAIDWAQNLNIGGYSDWRLPTLQPLNGISFNTFRSRDGSTDVGVNISRTGTVYAGSRASEIAYLYHNTLGNKSIPYIENQREITPPGGYFTNSGPFINLEPGDVIWTNRKYEPLDDAAWAFHLYNGNQYIEQASDAGRALAVRVGDVRNATEIPEPPMMILIGTIFLGVLGINKRRTN